MTMFEEEFEEEIGRKAYLTTLVRMRQIKLAGEAALLQKQGKEYKIPPDINEHRFRGMVKAYLNGSHISEELED